MIASRLRLIAVWLFVGAVLAGCSGPSTLRPFTTDGCSDFPDGTPAQRSLWRGCCVAHDRAYWRGGTYQERLDADLALEKCVAGVGEPAIAKVMLAGVRVGGSPFWPTSFRWGYGWPWPRGYGALTSAEVELVDVIERATMTGSGACLAGC